MRQTQILILTLLASLAVSSAAFGDTSSADPTAKSSTRTGESDSECTGEYTGALSRVDTPIVGASTPGSGNAGSANGGRPGVGVRLRHD